MKYEDIPNCNSVVGYDDGTIILGFNDNSERAPTSSEVLSNSQSIRLEKIRGDAAAIIETKWPLWKQNNCAMGVYPESVAATCADDIAAVIAASNAAEDAVDAATTVAEVEAVTPVWPII